MTAKLTLTLAAGVALAISSNGNRLAAEIYRPGQTVPKILEGEVFTWAEGQSGSTFSGWDVFEAVPTAANPDITPDLGQFPSGTSPHAFYSETAALVTSTNNLYSFGVQEFAATVDPAEGGPYTRIVAQFNTFGSLDYDSILLSSDLAAAGTVAPSLLVETGRKPMQISGMDTVQFDALALWDLTDSQAAYRLDFNTSGPHMSLDKFSIDTFTANTPFITPTAIPEPTTWAGLAVSSLGFVGWRWRRRRAAAASA